MDKTAIVIGAGIVGLATARALAIRGYRVTVIERTARVVGASIRNFGMVWPIGQPDGIRYETAMVSRSIWKEACHEAGIWYSEAGSLHMAYQIDELAVLEEFAKRSDAQRACRMLPPGETAEKSAMVKEKGLLGALWSPQELIVDPRQAISKLPAWLSEKYAVSFLWNKTVTAIQYPVVQCGEKKMQADCIFICSGADFETLYPDLFSQMPLTKCKLQMMRLAAQPDGVRIGPSLCGGLSLTHYTSFAIAPALAILKQRVAEQYPEYVKWGIHVMASQNQAGEITIGDSHEYGPVHDPFDKQFINTYILDYLRTFARFPDETVTETWHGIYPRLTNGEPWLVKEAAPGVTIINGLGGAGMTLSFGLCERVIELGAGSFFDTNRV